MNHPGNLSTLLTLYLSLALAGCGRADDPDEVGDAEGPPGLDVPAPPYPSGSASRGTAPQAPERQEEAAGRDRLVIVAGGDVNLGRELGQRILGDPQGVSILHGLEPVLGGAHLTFVNLECQLSDQKGETQSPYNRLVFTGPPGGAEVLARAGIDLVSLANNHAWDYGKKAFLETLENLEHSGVRYVGASRRPEQMYEPIVTEHQGWSIAWFAVTQIWNQGPILEHYGQYHVAWARFDRLQTALARARKEHDVVLLSYHGGAEYVEFPMQWTRAFAGVVMQMGVDAIVGHHPHIPLGVGWHQQRPIFYSLGNLVFRPHKDHPNTGIGFLARLTFERGREPLVEACPYQILEDDPVLLRGAMKTSLTSSFRSHLRRLSVTAGGSEVGEPDEQGCMRLGPSPPRLAGAAKVREAHPTRVAPAVRQDSATRRIETP